VSIHVWIISKSERRVSGKQIRQDAKTGTWRVCSSSLPISPLLSFHRPRVSETASRLRHISRSVLKHCVQYWVRCTISLFSVRRALHRIDSTMEDGKNANPLILNPSDLPTRKRRTSDHKEANLASELFPYGATAIGDSLYRVSTASSSSGETSDNDSDSEPIDEQEIYDLIATMSDPEHPITLGALAVLSLPDISIKPTIPDRPWSNLQTVTVLVTPTIQHCSLATVIGLGVRVRLEESLPARFRVDVRIKEGTHSTADEVNKQLADKERVAAALWNPTLQSFIKKMMETCE
jgi:metal-sulfur cluster biosynthetic enzyme